VQGRRRRWVPPIGRLAAARDAREGHAAARRLLAERMDGPLDPDSAAALGAHLTGCARCRSVDRAYQEGRRLLQALRPSVPPRDLGARVAAALDRELAGGRPGILRNAPAISGRLGIVAGGAIAAVLLVAGARLLLAPAVDHPGPGTTSARAPAPTPFAVTTAELALVELGDDGLAIYQTHVDQVCPATAADCQAPDGGTRRVVDLSPDLVPERVALDPLSRRMALVAEDALGADRVSVLVLPPMPDAVDLRGAGPGPDGRWPAPDRPSSGPLGGTAFPGDPAAPSEPPAGPELLAILDGVQTVGAPPAWSPDGAILAFSAMPLDRSRGPDVYVWRPGELRAHRLTTDHRSWFASWSGDRIVLSRLVRDGRRGVADTVLVDPQDGREQLARLTGAWLPSVDPSGRFAVAWRGTVGGGDAQVGPRSGGLALVDWTQVDPEASGRPLPAEPPTAEAGSGRAGRTGPVAASDPSAAPVLAYASGPFRARSATRSVTAAALPKGDRPARAWLETIESGTRATPAALDWQVHWARSGLTFGYWMADARGASWGNLTVLRVSPETGRLDRERTLLGPTLARRSFSLGEDRIAWVAPADEGADGELRVRTWGRPGEGTLRIRDIPLRHGIPAF
jgi:hypothetical protein